jgi:hypothetical protein
MEDIWTNHAPAPRDFALVRLVRVPCTGIIQGIITAEDYLGCYTHWDKYRTQPCTGNGCPYDKAGVPRRWQGYIDIYGQLTERQIVIQITPLAAQALDAAKKHYGYLRGLLVAFDRVAKRPNARIQVATRQLPQPFPQLPTPIDIRKYMALIWQSDQAFES